MWEQCQHICLMWKTSFCPIGGFPNISCHLWCPLGFCFKTTFYLENMQIQSEVVRQQYLCKTTSFKYIEKWSSCVFIFEQVRGSPPQDNSLRLGCGLLGFFPLATWPEHSSYWERPHLPYEEWLFYGLFLCHPTHAATNNVCERWVIYPFPIPNIDAHAERVHWEQAFKIT